ncbi:hypothetical protein DM01DRAFT_1331804 [Hesseltinella vesiculosa]|uniref:Mitochondrial ribosomal protein subunit L20 n=1 Tax=Hesseltinella vesiculosa TaxID=101127 RepID=A0A1X2GWM1_9FUNG|nr:hypothetical protein DM01DRAFT_1331804 [Hesseltinella vesiculosa]
MLRQIGQQVRNYATKSKAPNRKMTAQVPVEKVILPDGSKFITRRAPVSDSQQQAVGPVLHPRQPQTKLTDEQINSIRSLRQQDPETWTRKKLADKFNCSPLFISMIAPTPSRAATPSALQSTAAGYRRQLITKNRQRRKELW